VGDIHDVDAINCPVVIKIVSVPIAAIVAIAGVTEAVVNAAIEADVQTPIAAVEAPAIVIPAPITGGPESAIIRRSAPGAWNPIIACGSPTPVARGPDVVGGRSFRLLIFR
jgi:hypothetical protein